jgi:type VII secretion-associated serine protease mycosin
MRSRVVAMVAASLAAAISFSNAVLPALAADEISDGQWYHQFLNTAQAHELTQGEGVVAAVIDSGVDASHPDLAGSVMPGTDLTSGGPGDGRTDHDGHGTRMASLIAAHGRVRGIAPRTKILPVRVGTLGRLGGSEVSVGIKYAVAQGAKVISMSLGGDDDPLQRQEVTAALAADVVIVAGVGNLPKDTSVQYPAAYPGVVAVAAIDKNGEHAPVSVTGPQVVIAAPGAGISGAYTGGKYEINTGTSDATAIVAGAVALIRARFPQLKAADVVRRLTDTATDKGSPGRDPEYGYGVINLVGALTAEIPAATTSSTASKQGGGSSKPDGMPWVLVAAAVGLVVAVVGFVVWARRRRPSAGP